MNLRIGASTIHFVPVKIAEKNLNLKCGIFGSVLINIFSGVLFGLKRHTLVDLILRGVNHAT